MMFAADAIGPKPKPKPQQPKGWGKGGKKPPHRGGKPPKGGGKK